MRIIVILFIAIIFASLGSALFYMIRDKGTTERTAKALTVRVALSVLLFLLLMLGFHFGLITTRLYTQAAHTGSGILPPVRNKKNAAFPAASKSPCRGYLLPVRTVLRRPLSRTARSAVLIRYSQ